MYVPSLANVFLHLARPRNLPARFVNGLHALTLISSFTRFPAATTNHHIRNIVYLLNSLRAHEGTFESTSDEIRSHRYHPRPLPNRPALAYAA